MTRRIWRDGGNRGNSAHPNMKVVFSETRGAAQDVYWAGKAVGPQRLAAPLSNSLKRFTTIRLALFSQGRREGGLHDGFIPSSINRGLRGGASQQSANEKRSPRQPPYFGHTCRSRPIAPLAVHATSTNTVSWQHPAAGYAVANDMSSRREGPNIW